MKAMSFGKTAQIYAAQYDLDQRPDAIGGPRYADYGTSGPGLWRRE